MKRYLQFKFLLAAVIIMICGTNVALGKIVTNINQLKAGCVIKIYPKDIDGSSHYGETMLTLVCHSNEDILYSNSLYPAVFTRYSEWTLENAGGGYYYLRTAIGQYWSDREISELERMRCVRDKRYAVKVSFTWDSKHDGVCFRKEDGTPLTHRDETYEVYNWSSHSYNSEVRTTFDVAIVKDEKGESVADIKEITYKDINYILYLDKKTAKVSPTFLSGDVVIPRTIEYDGTEYTVSSIGYRGFFYANKMSGVTLPESILSLPEYCFYGCSSLINTPVRDMFRTKKVALCPLSCILE